MLDLGDFIDVLERNLAADLVAGVHGTAQAVLARLDIGSVQQKVGGSRRAQVEEKRAIGADGDARGDGDTDVDVGSTGVEFLYSEMSVQTQGYLEKSELTLQKSILLTPLLPSAGPTGGLGLACPAPTMSLTN